MWFGLVVLCCLKKCQIILDQFKSSHYCLNRFKKVSDFMWIDSHLFESIHVCIVSFLLESSHKTLWLSLNRFIRSLNRINLHPRYIWIDSIMFWIVSSFILLWSVFFLSESIQAFRESIQSVKFVRKLSLFTLHNIYTSLHISKSIKSFATILSRSQKLIVHIFFKIKHFFLESLCSLSV